MSWNYELGIVFDDYQLPVPCTLMLIKHSRTHSCFEQMTGVDVYKVRLNDRWDKNKNLIEGRVHYINFDHTPNIDEVQRGIEKFSGEEYMIESTWRTKRYHYDEPSHLKDDWIRFYLKGKQFIPQPQSHISHVILDVGNSNKYNFTIGKGIIAAKNMDLLASELECVVKLGVRTIHGYDGDLSADPREHSLCYHRELDDFVDDIYWNSEKPSDLTPLTPDILVEVAKTCNHLEAVQYGNGMLVYNRHGVSENLRQFYELLTLKLKAND